MKRHLSFPLKAFGSTLLLSGLFSILSPATAQAETNVTLYGLIDQGIGFERKSGESRLWQASNTYSGSRWGLRGTEDLGDGLRALFLLESGFNPHDGRQGQGRLFGRAAYLGLAGNFGEVRVGRQSVLSNSWGDIATSFGWGDASIGQTFGYDDGDFGASGRVNNAVMYLSPTLSGWQVGVGYSFQTHDKSAFETDQHDRVWTSGIRYKGGPFSAALTYEQLVPDVAVVQKMKSNNVQLAAAYNLEWVSLHAGFGQLRDPNSGPSKGHSKVDSWATGFSVPLSGVARVHASYQRTRQSDLSVWATGYEYALSKRTNTYAVLSRLDREQEHALQAIVGVRHVF